MWMQKYKKISRFLTFKRFLYQTEEYFYIRVTVTGEVECHETRSRSESEPEEGA